MKKLVLLISIIIFFKAYLFAACQKNIYKEHLSLAMLKQSSYDESFRAHDCKNLDSSIFIKEKDIYTLTSEEFFKYFKNDDLYHANIFLYKNNMWLDIKKSDSFIHFNKKNNRWECTPNLGYDFFEAYEHNPDFVDKLISLKSAYKLEKFRQYSIFYLLSELTLYNNDVDLNNISGISMKHPILGEISGWELLAHYKKFDRLEKYYVEKLSLSHGEVSVNPFKSAIYYNNDNEIDKLGKIGFEFYNTSNLTYAIKVKSKYVKEILNKLIEYKVVSDKYKLSEFIYVAAKYDNLDAVKAVLKLGKNLEGSYENIADTNSCNADYLNPMGYAKKYNNDEMYVLLNENGFESPAMAKIRSTGKSISDVINGIQFLFGIATEGYSN